MKRDLSKLSSRVFDVLVIGGGIHGAITAWDAAQRGLSVALIERGDFGSATSQNSLKIIHGGLRYLQDGNLTRIRTMARERATWMRIAPHLVHPLRCLTPTRQKISRSRLVMGIALRANDLLSFDRSRKVNPEQRIPGGKIISREELSDLLPGYDISKTTGAATWHDGQIYNSERLLLGFILSATDAGAEVANYVEAIDFSKRGNHITGVQARDVQSGSVLEIQSRIVINCAGAWIDTLLRRVALRSGFATSVAMNLILDQVWPGIAAGLPSQPCNGKRPQILFIVPWRDKSIIGTWHIPWDDEPENFQMNDAIVQGFLDEINSAHPALGLSLKDIRHVAWGFLPAKKQSGNREEVKLTRDGAVIDHRKRDGIDGLISILGVKYTTARVVAEHAVDLATDILAAKTAPCRTHITQIRGGRIHNLRTVLEQARTAAPTDLDEEIVEHLAYTYGSQYSDLLEHMEKQPDLAQRIDPGLPVTAAEIYHAIHQEMALTLADAVQRRTELGATGLPSATTLQKCAELMGGELGWSRECQEREIDAVIQAYPFGEMAKVAA